MRRIVAVAALAVLLLPMPARTGGQAEPPAATDKDRIQGTWEVKAVEYDGRAIPDGPELKRFQEVKLTFQGDAVISSRDKDGQGRFTLDSSKKPAALDIITTKKSGETKMLYVYDLDKDILRLCFTRHSDVFRPLELTSAKEQFILVFKRPKPSEK